MHDDGIHELQKLVALMPYKDPIKQKAAQHAAYERTSREVIRKRRKQSRRGMKARGVPAGAYRKYLGLEHGRPTDAQRAELRAILDALPPKPSPKPKPLPKPAARRLKAPGERVQRTHRRRSRSCASDAPAPIVGPEAASRDRGKYLFARLTHPAGCDCQLCFELRWVLPP